MSSVNQRKLSILPIFLVVFLDMIGVGIIIPILAPLLFSSGTGPMPSSFSEEARNIVFGFLMAAYPLAQFFGAPILGALSDRYGRKKTLTFSLAGTFIGYLIFAIGIVTSNLYLLFLSRIADGFTGGNISVAQSAIADISDEKEKSRNFGLIGMAFGLGFILGPFIGGKLSDSSVISWFNFSTPFFFAALLSAINIFLIFLKFRETLHVRSQAKINALTGFKNISKAFAMKELRAMFAVMFLLIFGFNFFTQFFQVYLIQTFQFHQSQIGDIFAYAGIWIAFTQGVMLRPLSRKYNAKQIVKASALILGIALVCLLLPTESWQLYLVLPFVAIGNGLTHPNATAIISNLASKETQGEILGINQSFQSLAMAIPPIVAGFIVSIDKNLPIFVASITTIIAWLAFITLVGGKINLAHSKASK